MTPPLVVTVMVGGVPISAELPAATLEALRQALASDADRRSAYLTADEAADLMRCRKRRVYELVGDGRLTRHGDGRRLLVARLEVERLASGEVTTR